MSTSKSGKERRGLKFIPGVALPKLLPYDKMVNYIKTIDFNENIKDMATEFSSDRDDSEVVNGPIGNWMNFFWSSEMYHDLLGQSPF